MAGLPGRRSPGRPRVRVDDRGGRARPRRLCVLHGSTPTGRRGAGGSGAAGGGVARVGAARTPSMSPTTPTSTGLSWRPARASPRRVSCASRPSGCWSNEKVWDAFVPRFVAAVKAMKIGTAPRVRVRHRFARVASAAAHGDIARRGTRWPGRDRIDVREGAAGHRAVCPWPTVLAGSPPRWCAATRDLRAGRLACQGRRRRRGDRVRQRHGIRPQCVGLDSRCRAWPADRGIDQDRDGNINEAYAAAWVASPPPWAG